MPLVDTVIEVHDTDTDDEDDRANLADNDDSDDSDGRDHNCKCSLQVLVIHLLLTPSSELLQPLVAWLQKGLFLYHHYMCPT